MLHVDNEALNEEAVFTRSDIIVTVIILTVHYLFT